MFHKGQHVRLKPFEDNPEERGTILSDAEKNGTWVVEVDPEYRSDWMDDGLREVGTEQMEPLETSNDTE